MLKCALFTVGLVAAAVGIGASANAVFAADFAARCAAAGVIKCVGFDAPEDISGGYRDPSGIFSGATTPTLDASVKASGTAP